MFHVQRNLQLEGSDRRSDRRSDEGSDRRSWSSVFPTYSTVRLPLNTSIGAIMEMGYDRYSPMNASASA